MTDIVTATDIKEIQAEILECLSPEGMQRYKVPAQKPQPPTIAAQSTPVSERYLFTCQDIRIAVAGCQRRVGVTTTAANLAHWIQAHGGTACYLESNLNKHLSYIIKLYADQPEDDHYTIGGVDYYFTSDFDKAYNFIIIDCGVLDEPPQACFAEADLRLLCGSAMPYELVHMQNALSRCKNGTVQALGMYVPLDVRELMKQAITDDLLFVDSSHELFDGNANSNLNKRLVSNYITRIMDSNEAVQRV
ncbi:hypothetical protein [Desulfosporosinus lacus]|uniref:hypothetical protein n=1 Tax=Desulfosporosinus lacus TaxID=329936 RepID=UPI001160FDDE|nr:hypothetical protein [Desulfosporosinus lacus]